MLEGALALLNKYPILWVVYGVSLILPVVVVISYFFWPKESDTIGQRKKTDAPSPDDKAQEELSDSGIEASGENDRHVHIDSKERDVSPKSFRKHQSHDSDTRHKSLENGYQNGTENELVPNDKDFSLANGDVVEGEEETESMPAWSFPPVLEDFDLIESDIDPSELEAIFADKRLTEIKFRIEHDGPGIGISIVGGSGSPNGDLPVIVKRVLPGSLAERDGTLKSGDELIAVNETLLVGVRKDFAINALSKMEGDVRLLVLQDE